MEDTYKYIHNQVISGTREVLKNNKIKLNPVETEELIEILTEGFVKQNLAIYDLFAAPRMI